LFAADPRGHDLITILIQLCAARSARAENRRAREPVRFSDPALPVAGCLLPVACF
jgi:hypothetical protein